MIIFLTIMLLIYAFIALGRMDKSEEGDLDESKNKATTSNNKYHYPLQPYKPKWYYFKLITPKYKEAFPFSTTALVFLTDYWHTQKFIFMNCFILALSINIFDKISYMFLSYLGIRLLYLIFFNLEHKE